MYPVMRLSGVTRVYFVLSNELSLKTKIAKFVFQEKCDSKGVWLQRINKTNYCDALHPAPCVPVITHHLSAHTRTEELGWTQGSWNINCLSSVTGRSLICHHGRVESNVFTGRLQQLVKRKLSEISLVSNKSIENYKKYRQDELS